jgi:hypothetical protein
MYTSQLPCVCMAFARYAARAEQPPNAPSHNHWPTRVCAKKHPHEDSVT